MTEEMRTDIMKALGFGEAMEALDKLVKSATVGGKEKAEQPDPVETAKQAALKRAAADLYEAFEAFADAGFDEDQAFAITLELFKGASQK